MIEDFLKFVSRILPLAVHKVTWPRR
jgi:hypothetical protein